MKLTLRCPVLLVNQDQLDVLRQLRTSVDQEKAELHEQNARLRSELSESQDRNDMLVKQVNGLLMDKIDLQSQSIGQREEALKRERNLGELRASLAGKSLPKEAEEFISALQTSLSQQELQIKSSTEKLSKARAVSRVMSCTRRFPY